MVPRNRLETLRDLRLANTDMAFASAFGTLVSGAFFVGFIKYFNGSDYWIGLSAVPSILGILQIPGAIWGRGFDSYKRFVAPGGLMWRLFFFPLIALPFLPISDNAKLTLATLCTLLAACATFLVNPIYNDWLAEMVPPTSRGSFFSKRNAIGTAVGSSVGILGGLMLDAFKRTHQERLGFSVIFGLGAVLALISYYFFSKMTDLPRQNPVRQSLWKGIIAFGAPFADTAYRPVLYFLGFATLGQGFAGSLFFAYGLETLHLPFTVLQLAGACQALGTVLSSRFWAFASDKYGNKPMLAIAGLLLALNPIPWILCRPDNLAFDTTLLLCTHILMGVLWGGVNLCQFNIMLSTAKEEDRANYLGAGMAITALIGGLSPMAGAFLMSSLRHAFTAQNSYQLVFAATAVLRGSGMLWLTRVREAGSTTLSTALQHFKAATPTGVRALRRLSRSSDASTREAALEELGDQGFAMAADEMVKALYDPLPRIRRQAAQALARLNDPASQAQAAAALIEQLEQHPDLMEEESIEALGSMRELRAVEPLARLLQSPRSLVRRAAARALGRLGSPVAITALIEVVGSTEDGDLRRAAIQSLRGLGAREAAATLAAAVLDPRPSVRVAACEAVAELEIREAAPNLRVVLGEPADETVSAAAYALGSVGDFADIALLLKAVQGCTSTMARRQALLGIARLVGVEREAYRLMLLEGMDRDTALMDLTKAQRRRSRRVQAALTAYSGGNEAAALASLAQAFSHPAISALASHPVEESFLIAIALACQVSAADATAG